MVGDIDQQHEHYGEHQQYKPQKDIVGLQEVLHGAIIRQGNTHDAVVISLSKIKEGLLRRRGGANKVPFVRLNSLNNFRTCKVVVHFSKTYPSRIVLHIPVGREHRNAQFMGQCRKERHSNIIVYVFILDAIKAGNQVGITAQPAFQQIHLVLLLALILKHHEDYGKQGKERREVCQQFGFIRKAHGKR